MNTDKVRVVRIHTWNGVSKAFWMHSYQCVLDMPTTYAMCT